MSRGNRRAQVAAGTSGDTGDVRKEAITLAWGLPAEEVESDPPAASILGCSVDTHS